MVFVDVVVRIYIYKKTMLTLAKPARLDKNDYSGWLASTKLDGYRAAWNDNDRNLTLATRTGKPYHTPADFVKHLPRDIPLDGELLLEHESFEAHGALRRHDSDPVWQRVMFHVFDIITDNDQPFAERYEKLQGVVNCHRDKCKAAGDRCVLKLVKQHRIVNNDDAIKRCDEITASGGEGLMLRDPTMSYERKRTSRLVKMKKVDDSEAVIEGYELGKGRLSSMIGAYKVHLLTNPQIQFNVAGMTDEQRNLEHALTCGDIITIYHNGHTKTGIPRFPRLKGRRHMDVKRAHAEGDLEEDEEEEKVRAKKVREQ